MRRARLAARDSRSSPVPAGQTCAPAQRHGQAVLPCWQAARVQQADRRAGFFFFFFLSWPGAALVEHARKRSVARGRLHLAGDPARSGEAGLFRSRASGFRTARRRRRMGARGLKAERCCATMPGLSAQCSSRCAAGIATSLSSPSWREISPISRSSSAFSSSARGGRTGARSSPCVIELRRGAALVDARHLPGELLHVRGGVARDEQPRPCRGAGSRRHSSRPIANARSDRDRSGRACAPGPCRSCRHSRAGNP